MYLNILNVRFILNKINEEIMEDNVVTRGSIKYCQGNECEIHLEWNNKHYIKLINEQPQEHGVRVNAGTSYFSRVMQRLISQGG